MKRTSWQSTLDRAASLRERRPWLPADEADLQGLVQTHYGHTARPWEAIGAALDRSAGACAEQWRRMQHRPEQHKCPACGQRLRQPKGPAPRK